MGGKRGIGVFMDNLIKGLSAVDKKNEYVLFGWCFRDHDNKASEIYLPKQENFKLSMRRFPDSLANALEWGAGIPVINHMLRGERIDLYYSPGLRLPKLPGIRSVVTVHDMYYFNNPERCSKANRRISDYAIRNASAISVNSGNSLNDLKKYHPEAAERARIINSGFDLSPFKQKPSDETDGSISARYKIPEKFVLSVGPFNPHKNHITVLKAFSAFVRNNPGTGHSLVLAGAKSFEYENLARAAVELGISDRVVFTGYISKEDLILLYRKADAMVFLSLNEGFGSYVMLEAMACGCPIIVSNVSSMPEPVGDAGMLVNPEDPAETAAALNKVLSDRALRADLSARSLRRAEQFNHIDFAKKFLDLFNYAMERKL